MKIPLVAVALWAFTSGLSAHAQAASPLAWENEAVIVSAELAKGVDTKSAKPGSQITARTLRDVRLDDGAMLPKDSSLVGHVIQVRAKSGSSPDALLVLRFDRVVLSDEHAVAVQVMVRSIAEPRVASSASPFGPMPGSDSVSDASMPGTGLGAGTESIGTGGGGSPGANRGTSSRGDQMPAGNSSPLDTAGQMPSGAQPVANAGSTGSNAIPEGRSFPVGNLHSVSFSNAEMSANAADGAAGSAPAASMVLVLKGEGKNFSLDRGTRLELSVLSQ